MILLLGPSASGKTEVAKCLASHFSILKAITHTTRPMRVNEHQDVDYHFVSKEEFLRLKGLDAFVETTLYNGNYYGCSKDECGDEKCIVLDPQGIASFLKLNNPHIVSFYLEVPEEIRKSRMELRGDKKEDIASRLSNDRIAFSKDTLPPIDFVIEAKEKTPVELAADILALYKGKLGA